MLHITNPLKVDWSFSVHLHAGYLTQQVIHKAQHAFLSEEQISQIYSVQQSKLRKIEK